MSADNALAALYYLASLAPAHLRPRGLRRPRKPRKPREQTDADRAALAAAELKRARKNAKRLAKHAEGKR